jgi:hypothetical protein
MTPRRLVVIGTLAGNPYAGMAWMAMQIVVGLRRLGHDVYYMETTSDWPFDAARQAKVQSSEYATAYLARVAESFGMGDRWAYRRSYSDKEWRGLSRTKAEDVLATADAVFDIAGATRLDEEGLHVKRYVYYGTDPVHHELRYASGDSDVRSLIDEHDDCVTYGENIGHRECLIPPLPRLRARTRQPVLLDVWEASAPTKRAFTTVGNWQQLGLDVDYEGDTYRWSKHHEFLKFLDLPHRVSQPIELATNLGERTAVDEHGNEAVPALGVEKDARRMLESKGWSLVSGHAFTTDPWPYHEYVKGSRAEFTVARDLNVRLRSGWFSERSACYLAAGRPVVTQDTGFGTVLPTGEGLFAFQTIEEAISAIETINGDYARHSRAARSIAQEYFRAEKVLSKLLSELSV